MERIRGILSSFFSIIRKEEPEKLPSYFLENGSNLLKEFITQWNGRCIIPIRSFSAQELNKATNNFDSHGLIDMTNYFIDEDAYYRIYRGSFEEHQILVKDYRCSNSWTGERLKSIVVTDAVISLQMSIHKNVLKLIGCCLEFELPALVYQCPEAFELLFHDYWDKREVKLSWKNRLSIAGDIANVLVYLHSQFHTPVIFRNLKPSQVVVDQYGVAKLFDFSMCVLLPQGKSQVESELTGTYGYVDPDYIDTGILTEKTDVYNIGTILVEFLTGKKVLYICLEANYCSLWEILKRYLVGNKLKEIVDSKIVMEGESVKENQLRAFATLALRCLEEDRDNRPRMIVVAKELRRMQRLHSPH